PCLDSMAETVLLALGAFHTAAMFAKPRVGGAPSVPQLLHRRDILLEAGERIEQAAVGRGIDQRALIMLAVNFHQCRTNGSQSLHADRLADDKGPGAAVGATHAVQCHLAVLFKPLGG